MVLTPDGKVSRYFYGVEYSAEDLRLSLDEAAGRNLFAREQVLLFCFRYDPSTGKYSLMVVRMLQMGADPDGRCDGNVLVFHVPPRQKRANGINNGYGFSTCPGSGQHHRGAGGSPLLFPDGGDGVFHGRDFVAILYLGLKYRRRPGIVPQHVETNATLEIAWTGDSAGALPLHVWLGRQALCHDGNAPKDAMEITSSAKQWMWKIQHPEGQARDQHAACSGRPRDQTDHDLAGCDP